MRCRTSKLGEAPKEGVTGGALRIGEIAPLNASPLCTPLFWFVTETLIAG